MTRTTIRKYIKGIAELFIRNSTNILIPTRIGRETTIGIYYREKTKPLGREYTERE